MGFTMAEIEVHSFTLAAAHPPKPECEKQTTALLGLLSTGVFVDLHWLQLAVQLHGSRQFCYPLCTGAAFQSMVLVIEFDLIQ